MRLRDLLVYNRIVIQCHDNPDADAIGSGFGLYTFFRNQGKEVSLVYSGRNRIKKSNLIKMVDLLEIPIKYVDKIEDFDLLIMVDCQYGQGNVTKFEAENIAVIDHHVVTGELPELSEVRSNLGGCSTLVWTMLRDEGYDANLNEALATALYYGLYMDTGAMAELSHPMDRDLRDQANVDLNILGQLRNSNLSIEELEIAGTALLRTDMMEEYHCAIVKANQCDPNILGIISDLVLEVDIVEVCVVFTQQEGGVKFSVRSCIKEVMADEMAAELASGIGSGGGHVAKAGGFIRYDLFIPEYEKYCKEYNMTPRIETDEEGKRIPAASACKAFLETRIRDYFDNTMIVDAADFDTEQFPFETYLPRKIAYGYVVSTDLFPAGTKVRVRSIDEEDLVITVQEQMLFLIGNKGDVNAVSKSYFEERFRLTEWHYDLLETEYTPTVRIDQEGSASVSLVEKAQVCIPLTNRSFVASRLSQNIKLFDIWDNKAYKKGEKGDYLMMRNQSSKDLVIMEKELFENRYISVEEMKKNQVQAVVFDLDGTLLDTLEDLADAVNAALRKVGLPERTIGEVRRFVGNGVGKLMERSVQEGKDDPKLPEALESFKKFYADHSQDKTLPYEGIYGLLDELKLRGIKMAIVSNKIDSAVKELAEVYFKDYLTVAIGECEGIKRKPAPDTVFAALKELGVSPEHALYVGDSEVDIETAKNAGMEIVSVTWGFKGRSFLEKHGAKRIIDLPTEILRYV